jgi:Tfp pilus assembly protein PilX
MKKAVLLLIGITITPLVVLALLTLAAAETATQPHRKEQRR